MKIRGLITIISVVILGCGKNSEPYFLSEPYIVVADVKIKDKPISREIKGGEDYNMLNAVAKNGMLIIYAPINPNHFFDIFDMNSGENLGGYCIKGRGPMESDNMYPFFEVYQKDNCIMADVIDASRERLFVWNITRSIEEHRSIYDTIQPLPWRKIIKEPVAHNFRLNDSEFFMTTPASPIDDIDKVITPRIEVRSYSDLSISRKYKIFADSVVDFGFERAWSPLDPFSASYTINRDRNKVAMVMHHYPQINIIDLDSGEMKCFRSKRAPSVGLLKNITFHRSVASDGNCIYALYAPQDNSDTPHTNAEYDAYKDAGKYRSQIHIFDWNGNLVDKWQLSKEYSMICVDGDKLYAIQRADGTIDIYEINR